ncbi:hypothetical protein O181_087030 [Austropuccinia psidii MF-1]|uniref:Uncharacterized protein n=1 Tax=Austropuccinia psidii MF-1 TaxID=1389203 RepID=A0A9Q3INY5_9BASI|nr:hypothetical protein [Austropuccinia psidii MF-1]
MRTKLLRSSRLVLFPGVNFTKPYAPNASLMSLRLVLAHAICNNWALSSFERQGVVALSTCAAEYIALSDSTQHLVQAICQLTHLTKDFDKTTFCNHQAAVPVSIDILSRKQIGYLNCALFFVDNAIRKHEIKVTWVRTAEMQADKLTKHLSGLTLQQAVPFLWVDG